MGLTLELNSALSGMSTCPSWLQKPPTSATRRGNGSFSFTHGRTVTSSTGRHSLTALSRVIRRDWEPVEEVDPELNRPALVVFVVPDDANPNKIDDREQLQK
ncbi:hypothetical protein ElyMa_003122800 [Elysia marginata]|uniref:Uncharacterized protein n=1 Tax=Elysia marginata TaxID=1093978 RepID=A0AAV4IRY6_9GAST|nr:hypothetical protein ElyMa_003122800 [Elysia marginata]